MKNQFTILLLLISSLAFGQMRNYNIKVVAMHPGGYTRTYDVAVFTPLNYDSTKEYDSDFSLHGGGQVGPNINNIYSDGYLWVLKNNQVTVDRLVFGPQNHYGGYDGFFPGIVTEIEKRYKIKSFAICGFSFGGGNTWEAINGVSAAFSAKWRAAESLSPSSFGVVNMSWIANSKTKFLSRAGTQSADAGFIGNAIAAHNAITVVAPGRSRLITKAGIGHGGSFTEPYRDTVFLNFMKPATDTAPPVVIVPPPPPPVATTVFTAAQLKSLDRIVDSTVTARATQVVYPLYVGEDGKLYLDSMLKARIYKLELADKINSIQIKALFEQLEVLYTTDNALKTRQNSYDALIEQLILLLGTYKR